MIARFAIVNFEMRTTVAQHERRRIDFARRLKPNEVVTAAFRRRKNIEARLVAGACEDVVLMHMSS